MRQDPEDLRASHELIVALGTADRADEAMHPEATRVLQRVPDDPRTLFDLGITLARQKRLSEASSVLQRLLTVNPDYPQAKQTLQAILDDEKATTR